MIFFLLALGSVKSAVRNEDRFIALTEHAIEAGILPNTKRIKRPPIPDALTIPTKKPTKTVTRIIRPTKTSKPVEPFREILFFGRNIKDGNSGAVGLPISDGHSTFIPKYKRSKTKFTVTSPIFDKRTGKSVRKIVPVPRHNSRKSQRSLDYLTSSVPPVEKFNFGPVNYFSSEPKRTTVSPKSHRVVKHTVHTNVLSPTIFNSNKDIRPTLKKKPVGKVRTIYRFSGPIPKKLLTVHGDHPAGLTPVERLRQLLNHRVAKIQAESDESDVLRTHQTPRFKRLEDFCNKQLSYHPDYCLRNMKRKEFCSLHLPLSQCV